jgi:hypothetical protein
MPRNFAAAGPTREIWVAAKAAWPRTLTFAEGDRIMHARGDRLGQQPGLDDSDWASRCHLQDLSFLFDDQAPSGDRPVAPPHPGLPGGPGKKVLAAQRGW